MKLNRKQLETIVLSMGIIIILVAVFMMFFNKSSPKSIFWTNLIFAVGFLIYILYSMMTTNSLNREITGLNNHIKSLKDDIQKKDNTIQQKNTEIDRLQEDNDKAQKNLETAQNEIGQLKKEVESLKSTE